MNQPMAEPATTSPGKCCRAPTRANTTVDASPYARIGTIRGCGYWCAITEAIAQVLNGVLIGGDQRDGGRAEDTPEFRILLRGVKRTGPDRLLVLHKILRHAHERMKESGFPPDVLLLDDWRSRFHFQYRALLCSG